MITFYPRELSMWNDIFDFNPPITCIRHEKEDYKTFRDRAEMIEFFKEHGVCMDDPEFPLEFVGPRYNFARSEYLYTVVRWTVIGWFRDDYR